MNLRSSVESSFERKFTAPPAMTVRAPGRVNLIGEHTDYNDGFVLPMAIDRAVWIALRPRNDRVVKLFSLDFDCGHEFSLDRIEKGEHDWIEYIKGTAWSLQETGLVLRGFEGIMAGDVPIGSGLSSSAATELAAARAFSAVSGFDWDPSAMALLCQRAENRWVGVNCGIMDQMISAGGRAGHALRIDCRTLELQAAPIPASVRVLVLDSAAPRTLAGSAYNRRRAECESAVTKLQPAYPGIRALRDLTPAMLESEAGRLEADELRRARHVVSENARVLESVDAMRREDMALLGRLMLASHESLRNDYEVSSAELDMLVDLSMATPGVLGARLTGAGFGGCAIALCETGAAESAAASIIEAYRHRSGREGLAFASKASDGASIA